MAASSAATSVMSAHRLGYKVIVLDPDPVSIAGAAADEQIVAAS